MRKRVTFCTFFLGIVAFVAFPLIINAAAVTHKVRSGDNLYSLAKKYKVSVEQLKNANGLRSNKLSLGQTIVIKDENTRTSKKDSRSKSSSKKIKAQERQREIEEPAISENDGDFIEYKVRRGDTLDNIATRFNIEKEELIETNGLSSRRAKKLSPGKTILIPRMVEEGDDEEQIVTLKGTPLKPWKNSDEKYMLVKVAKSFMGAPYKYGGNTLRGLDCSAYVKKIYEIFDVQLPRSAREQYHAGSKIAKDELAVGDLVFFKTRRYAKFPTHVGIFIGDGNFIHASSGKGRLGVKIDSLSSDFYSKAYIGATRVKGGSSSSAIDGAGQSPEAAQPTEKSSNNS